MIQRVRQVRADLPAGFVPIAAISLMLVSGANIVAPVLPVYAATFGVSSAQVGMVISAFALGRVFLSFAGGWLTNWVTFRTIAISGCLLAGLGSLGAAMTSDFTVLLIARVVQGAGSALYVSSALHQIIALAPAGRVGRLVGTYQSAFMIGLIIGPFVGGVSASLWGDRSPFVVCAGLAALGAVTCWVTLPGRTARPVATVADAEAAAKGGAPTVGPQRQVGALAFMALLSFGIYAVRVGVRNAVLPLFLGTQLEWTNAEIGILISIMAVGNVAVLPHAGRVLDRRGRRPVALVSTGATAVAAAAFTLFTQAWWVVAVAIAFGAAMGYAGVAPAVIAADIGGEKAGTAIGVQRTTMDIGLLVGPVGAGWLTDQLGFAAGLLAVGAFLAVITLACLRMPETSTVGRPAGQ